MQLLVPSARQAMCARAASLFAGLCLLVCGCAATRFDGSLLRKREVSYRVGVLDASFRRVHVEGNDLAFYSHGSGSISVNALCKDYDDVPSEALLNHLLFGTTHRCYVLDEEITLDGRAARHALVDAELDGVPLRLELYVLTRANCVFDLSYISDRKARAQAQFAQFVHAFRIVDVRLD
jgi:hypothetical protein